MKRIITLLLLLPTLAFGWSDRRKQTDPGPATTATLNLNTGEYTTYGGSKAGQAQDTGSSKVAEALAGKVDADSEFAYVNLTRYAEDQPDVAIEQRLANNEKGAATQLAAAVSGGAPSAVIAGIQNVLTTAIKERADYEKAKANRPKPDTAGISITSFMNGPGSHAATAIMGAKFGDTLAAKTRSNYVLNNETTRTDTSNTNDYSGVSNVLRHQLELAKIDLEMAKIKAASQVKPTTPPVVNPTEPKPIDPVTPPPADGTGLSDEEAKKIISGLQFLDGTDRNHPQVLRLVKMYGGRITHFGGGNEYNRAPDASNLWKPDSDSDGNLVVITSSTVKAGSVTVGGETVSKMSIGNGWRPHFRFGKPGAGGYGSSPKVVVEGVGSATISNPGTKQTFKLTGAAPVDPPPTTSSLFILEPDKLTLRPDFAAVVRKIDALANVNEPNNDPVFITAGKVGTYTWGIPKPLGSYPKGALPNTWRISLLPGVKIPDDVTYHRSIMQSFIQDGATKTYPPTTRE